jgi:hypothetical protein
MRARRPESVKTESDMSQAVACTLGKYAAREVRVRGCIFDVVAYNKKEKSFTLVESKRSKKLTGIGHAFGQLAAYSAMIATQGPQFLAAYHKKLTVPMHIDEWMRATDNYRRFKVEFYVALTDAACKQVPLLRSMKKILPDVGIIRVKSDGKCRRDIRLSGNKRDSELCHANTTTIKIFRNQQSGSRP